MQNYLIGLFFLIFKEVNLEFQILKLLVLWKFQLVESEAFLSIHNKEMKVLMLNDL